MAYHTRKQTKWCWVLQKKCLVFPVWTTVYWLIFSLFFIIRYDCFREIGLFSVSWIGILGYGLMIQDGVFLMSFPLLVYLFIKYWAVLFKFLRSGGRKALLGIGFHLLGGGFLFFRYNGYENRPDFGVAIAIIPPLSMFFYLAGFTILHKFFAQHNDDETRKPD